MQTETETLPTEKVECPSCHNEADQTEIQTHAGVCAGCHSKFRKEHNSTRNKTRDPKERHERKCEAIEEFHISQVDGSAGLAIDFPWAEIDAGDGDRGNPLVAELTEANRGESIPQLADAFKAILTWVWRYEHGGALRDPQAALLRLAALSAVIDPDLFDSRSYLKIGAFIGGDNPYTKAALSKTALLFQDRFGVHFRRSRRAGSRETFRTLQLERAKKKRDAKNV